MLKCLKCEAIIHDYYKECPNCKSDELKRLTYTQIEEDEVEAISPFAENGELRESEL